MNTSGSSILATEPGEWTVVLTNGWVLKLMADAYWTSDDGHHSFAVLLSGNPPSELVVARLPSAAIESIDGG